MSPPPMQAQPGAVLQGAAAPVQAGPSAVAARPLAAARARRCHRHAPLPAARAAAAAGPAACSCREAGGGGAALVEHSPSNAAGGAAARLCGQPGPPLGSAPRTGGHLPAADGAHPGRQRSRHCRPPPRSPPPAVPAPQPQPPAAAAAWPHPPGAAQRQHGPRRSSLSLFRSDSVPAFPTDCTCYSCMPG